MLAEHVGLHDVDLMFAVAVAALILAAIALVQSRLTSIIAWSAGLIALALVISWWPE